MSISPRRGLSRDFWIFWTGQAISVLGTSFTTLALPLLVYRLTGSAVNLAFSSAAEFLPYLLFGLIIGAWVDRTDRKRLMIVVNLLQALVIVTIPVLAAFGHLAVEWIYVIGFLASTLGICFNSAEFAVIPNLVGQDDLVTANGRLQASYSAMSIIGPLLAGGLAAVMPIERLLYIDAASFLIAALTLGMIARSFNPEEKRAPSSIRRDIVEGLRYVLGHPVLRNISLMMAMVNFVGATTGAELVFFARQRLDAGNAQIGVLFAAQSAGVIVLSLAAGPLRKRFSFSRVALSALMIDGLLTVGFAVVHWYPLSVVLWGLQAGFGILFNINTGSLRQAIVPSHLLGRVISIAGVLAWSAIPIGTVLGGVLIQRTGNVALIFGAIGVITTLIPLGFSLTALGHAERYLATKGDG
ncbi:MAG TPA: MFS transporter [Chloroflexota bacterium]|nr:MFS transporter [Chloroflexota bacterium]